MALYYNWSKAPVQPQRLLCSKLYRWIQEFAAYFLPRITALASWFVLGSCCSGFSSITLGHRRAFPFRGFTTVSTFGWLKKCVQTCTFFTTSYIQKGTYTYKHTYKKLTEFFFWKDIPSAVHTMLYICMYVLRKYDAWTTNGHTVTLYVCMYVCNKNARAYYTGMS